MARALLTASFALFYSIGVASLIYALILRFTRNEPFLGRFIACTAVMTAVVVSTTLLDAYGATLPAQFQDALRFVNLAGAAVTSYLLVAFAAEVFPFRADQVVRRIALFLSAVGLAFCVADVLFRGTQWLEVVILSIKNTAIVCTATIALLPRSASHPRQNGTYQAFLRTISITVGVLMPFVLWEEIGLSLGTFPLQVKGSLSLPAIYAAWSVAFIVAHLKHRTGAAGMAPDSAFFSRYGITPREGELLGFLVQGLRYKRIMSQLTISMPTVKSHVASLYRKTRDSQPPGIGQEGRLGVRRDDSIDGNRAADALLIQKNEAFCGGIVQGNNGPPPLTLVGS